MRRLIGIDFSGSADQWKANRKTSNVWLAFARSDGDRLRLDELKPVQALDGEGSPFERLSALLAASDAVVGIDASFSVPRAYVSDPIALWAAVAQLPMDGRPFPKARDFVEQLTPDAPVNGTKVYRASEAHWRQRKLNVRSNLWCGPRGGAAFTAACMTLLHRHPGPIWPFKPGGEGALLAETYPAGQLRAWDLNPEGYNGPSAAARKARGVILQAMARDHGLRAPDTLLGICIDNADALDAVLCAYGAKALADGRHPRRLPAAAKLEGWIVVDDPEVAVAAAPAAAEPAPAADPDPASHPEPEPERLVESTTEDLVQSLFAKAFEALAAPAPEMPTKNGTNG